jgi:hypothetical protein
MRLLMLVALLVAQRPALAEEDTVRIGLNCAYWSSVLTGDVFVVTKVLFVRGVYEGATAFHMDVFDETERVAAIAASPASTGQLAELFEKRYLRRTSYLALVSGLDEFCRDTQNENVWLTGAIKVVSMKLRGESGEAIEAEVQRLRAEPGP